jgi:hypothetical protein
MTVSRGAPYHLRIGSAWKHLAAVAPGVAVTPSRPTSFFTSIGNVVTAEVADVANRAWGLSFELEDADATRWLDYAAGHPDLDVWLLDENLAQVNMLAVSATEGQSATTILVDGIPMPAFVKFEHYDTKIRADVFYHLSFTTTAAAGAVIGWLETAGDVVEYFNAPPGSGPRRGSVSFRRDADTDLRVAWGASHIATAARLTQGSVDDHGFLPSRGATPCRVLVGDGAATYKMAWECQLALADSSYVLTEVD